MKFLVNVALVFMVVYISYIYAAPEPEPAPEPEAEADAEAVSQKRFLFPLLCHSSPSSSLVI